jgi:hypothetical protein
MYSNLQNFQKGGKRNKGFENNWINNRDFGKVTKPHNFIKCLVVIKWIKPSNGKKGNTKESTLGKKLRN